MAASDWLSASPATPKEEKSESSPDLSTTTNQLHLRMSW